MEQKKKKGVSSFWGILGAGFAAMGLILMVMNPKGILDFLAGHKKAYDALEVEEEEFRVGDHVTVDVTMSTGWAIYRSEYSREWKYYVIPTFRERRSEIRIDHMLLVSCNSDFKLMDEAEKRFYDWWESETGLEDAPSEVLVSVDGYVDRLTRDEKEYAKKYFGDDLPEYVIRPIGDESDRGLSGLSAGVFLIGFISLVIYLCSRRKQKKEASVL